MLKKQRQQWAFTMIELLVATTIIILLTTIGLVSFRQASVSSRNSKRKADLETVRQALTLYKQDNNYYAPSSSITFNGLVTSLYNGGYLSEVSLVDPKNVTPYIYQAICSTVSGTACVKVTLRTALEPDGTVYNVIAL